MSAGTSELPPWTSPARVQDWEAILDECNSWIRTFPDNPKSSDFGRRGWGEMYLGRLHEALKDLKQADLLHATELAQRYGPGKMWSGLNQAHATVRMLLGDARLASQALREEMKAILEWYDCFTDAAGGVGAGLLLWYIAVREQDKALEEEALSYLARIRESKPKEKFDRWPRHLADFVLGKLNFAALLEGAFGSMNLNELERRAYIERPAPAPGEVPKFNPDDPPTGLLLRGHLARALFYGGIKARRTDPAIGESLLRRCIQLKDVDIENEWYLSFLELGLVDPASFR